MHPRLKIAIVEDNDDLRALLAQDLTIAGYNVKEADSGEQLDDLFSANTFDVLIIDINLPGENGYSISSRYKRLNKQLCIVMLTARTTVEDKVTGYDAGADLYLTKPVSNSELLAVVASIERRLGAQKTFPDITMSLKNMTLTAKNTVALNRQETQIIRALCESSMSNLPYFKILEICGEQINETTKATLEVRIARLRKKFIDAGCAEKSFRAIRGDGYQLLLDVNITP